MEIKFDQILLQIINIGLLLFVLTKVLYKPIIKVLEERAKKIKEGLKAAEKNIQEAAKIEETKKKKLLEAQKEATLLIEKERKRASQEGQEIIRKAKSEAETAVQKEQKILFERLKDEERRLKNETTKIAALTAQKIIAQALGEPEQRKLIKRQIASLKKLKVR